MSDELLRIILALIPVIGAIITGFVIPYIKNKTNAITLENVEYWVERAVLAAEVLFDLPNSGEKKREYVIDFIDQMFNAKKEVITKDQIRILLEAVWREQIKDQW